MKKILALMLVLMMALSLAACGGKTDPAPSGSGTTAPDASQQEQTQSPDDGKPSDNSTAEPSGAELSAWLKTKTGKFYSQFSGKMYMEYEMEYEGTVMTVISATNGDKTYSESKMNGQSAGVSIMDGEDMYVIDHSSKTVMKMSLQTSGQEMIDTMIEESDVNPADMKSGTREVDGKTYDTEEWSVDGAKSILCFDGDKLAYMIAEDEGVEMVIKVIKIDGKVDDSLFEIPKDYQVVSY